MLFVETFNELCDYISDSFKSMVKISISSVITIINQYCCFLKYILFQEHDFCYILLLV